MKPIGTKTLTVTALLIAMILILLFSGSLQIERLQGLSERAGFTIGLFTFLVGAWLFRFCALGEPSDSYLRYAFKDSKWQDEVVLVEWKDHAVFVGRGQSDGTIEFNSFFMKIVALGICFCLSLIAFDARTVEVMIETPTRLADAGNRYCPLPKPPEEKPENIKAGCELIYRAVRLGYAKSLGSCAPDHEEEKLELCKLRQVDEPFIHYNARVLYSYVTDTYETYFSEKGFINRAKQSLNRQMDSLETLASRQDHIVKSAPKASHHIFTNLPYPQGTIGHYWTQWFKPNDCIDRYRALSHTIAIDPADEKAGSKIFDHVYGQMLFNPKYLETAGHCKEFAIHWNSPADACEQLQKKPSEFLRSMGISDDVKTVLKRIDERNEFMDMQKDIAEIHHKPEKEQASAKPRTSTGELKPRVEVNPATTVSFQCVMKVENLPNSKFRTLPTNIYGQEIKVREVLFPVENDTHRVHVGMYKYLSEAMADGFHYVGYMSHEGEGDANQWQVGLNNFENEDYYLSNLEYLKGADIFLGNDWLQQREDLLEVYPYYHHLYHFVELFRQQFRMQRTRL